MSKLEDIDKMIEDEELKEKVRDDPIFAIELLYKIGRELILIVDTIKDKDKCISLWSMVSSLENCWNAVNFARLWTDKHDIDLDSKLVDSLGTIYDAKEMTASCLAWGKYDSSHAYMNIINSINLSLNDLREVILEIEGRIFRKDKGE